jgi:Condensation domain
VRRRNQISRRGSLGRSEATLSLGSEVSPGRLTVDSSELVPSSTALILTSRRRWGAAVARQHSRATPDPRIDARLRLSSEHRDILWKADLPSGRAFALMAHDGGAAHPAGLSAAKRALLERRLASAREQTRPTIPRRDPEQAVPLSFAQWRLWFLEQLRPGTHTWHTPLAARLSGPLDYGALRRALETVVGRHATLRTVFVPSGGKLQPRVALTDRTAQFLVDDADEANVQQLVDAEVRRPFDLSADVLVRARVLRTGPEQHVLVLVAHHIACDGWSKGLLVSELCTAYDALCAGAEPELRPLAIDYADFSCWQRRWLTGETLERLLAYWKARLHGHPRSIALPTDRPRPARQGFEGAVERVAVPARLAGAVAALGREEGATPFMTMLAAFKVLLYAHCGQEDILVGSPAAMRSLPELEPIIGFFANTLVYRTNLSGRPSFRVLLARVRETALGALAHQDLPFEKVVEVVNPPRDPGCNPLVQVNLRVEGREPQVRLRGVTSETLVLDPQIARFDLAIELGASDDGFEGYLEYDSALFDRSTAVTFARDFVEVLEAVIDSPDELLTELAPVHRIRARRTSAAIG